LNLALFLASPLDELLTMWALTPDTEGVTCSCGNMVGDALCERPDLRSLPPADLAKVLGVSTSDAHTGIQTLARDVTGRSPYNSNFAGPIGSFDHVISKLGQPAPKARVEYAAPDAQGYDDAGDVGATLEHAERLEAVIDEGTHWSVKYSNGVDDVPKDPSLLDAMAVSAKALGELELAERLRLYAANIRDIGQPMPDPPKGFLWYFLPVVAVAGIFVLREFR
jgi:hypothetical protein